MNSRNIPGPIERILVINVARIGDTILAVPVFRALRSAFPKAEIVCLAHPKRVAVLHGLPQLDRCGPITKRWAPFMGWIGRRYDLALVFGREPALVAYALRAARHVVALPTGNPKLDRRLFAIIQDQGMMHAVTDRMRWLAAIGVSPSSMRMDYHVTPEEKDFATRLVTTHCGDRRPIIGFQIASFPTKAYRNWPLENFASLGKRIFTTFPEAGILVLGDRPDRNAAQRLERTLGQHCHALAGQLSLRQTAAVMQQLDLYVGVDTGPTHLAGALGIPLVALYHCLHPGRLLAPLDHPAYLGMVEHPTSLEDATDQCTMAEISVDRVWEHVQRALHEESQ